MEYTLQQGRWGGTKVARMYLSQAVADTGALTLLPSTKYRIRAAALRWKDILRQLKLSDLNGKVNPVVLA
eukprot:7144245-Pyramimonas_sp.AAC.1